MSLLLFYRPPSFCIYLPPSLYGVPTSPIRSVVSCLLYPLPTFCILKGHLVTRAVKSLTNTECCVAPCLCIPSCETLLHYFCRQKGADKMRHGRAPAIEHPIVFFLSANNASNGPHHSEGLGKKLPAYCWGQQCTLSVEPPKQEAHPQSCTEQCRFTQS